MKCLLADNTPSCTECRLECQENWDHGRQNLINKQTNNQIRIRKRFVMFESLKTKATERSSGEKEVNISTLIFVHKCAVVQFYPQLKFNIRRLSLTPPPPHTRKITTWHKIYLSIFFLLTHRYSSATTCNKENCVLAGERQLRVSYHLSKLGNLEVGDVADSCMPSRTADHQEWTVPSLALLLLRAFFRRKSNCLICNKAIKCHEDY